MPSWTSILTPYSPAFIWLMNETSGTSAADASGNGFTGTFTGTYTQGVTGPGTGNLGVTLDGISGFVGRAASAVGNVDAGEGVTLGVWAKFTTSTADLALISLANSGNNTPLYCFRTNGLTPKGVYAQFRTDGGSLNSTFANNVATTVADGNWHLFVTTYNSSTTNLLCYVDGVAVGTPTTLTFGTTTLNRTTVGAVQRTTNLAFLPGSFFGAFGCPSTLSAANILSIYNDFFATGYNFNRLTTLEENRCN